MVEIKGPCPAHQGSTHGSDSKHYNCGINFNKRRPVYDVGINDSDYVTQTKGKICKYYNTWRGMLQRCYSEAWHKKYPTYKGVKVCDEWLTFSNFKSWMEQQDWEGKQLDKDLLGNGKLYSPDTCCFLSKTLNSFIVSASTRCGNGLPVGVYKSKKRFQALCRNPFGDNPYVGNFKCETKAHIAYLKKKQEYAMRLADVETDQRIVSAIYNRFRIVRN